MMEKEVIIIDFRKIPDEKIMDASEDELKELAVEIAILEYPNEPESFQEEKALDNYIGLCMEVHRRNGFVELTYNEDGKFQTGSLTETGKFYTEDVILPQLSEEEKAKMLNAVMDTVNKKEKKKRKK